MYTRFGFILLAIMLTACNNSGHQENTASEAPAFPAPATPAPVQQQAPAGSPLLTPAQSSPNTGAVALNPAHGLPGHRCDIPEGAPLNSAPASKPVPLPQPPALNTTPVTTQPQAVKGNVRLNPAHGLPGHDCSVPVGQPLKS